MKHTFKLTDEEIEFVIFLLEPFVDTDKRSKDYKYYGKKVEKFVTALQNACIDSNTKPRKPYTKKMKHISDAISLKSIPIYKSKYTDL